MKITIRDSIFRGALVVLFAFAASDAIAASDISVHLPLLYNTFVPPSIGESYTDTNFGVAIKRLSDAPNTHNNAVSGQLAFVSTEYPTASPFNSDNTLLILQHQGYFGLYDGDGNYLQDLPFAVNAATEPRWSRTDSNALFYVSGNALMKLDVAARTSSIVHAFSEYAAIRGRGESDISRDGDHFVFAADELSTPSTPGLVNRYVFVYEISTNTKGAVLDTSGHAFNNLYIAPNNGVAIGWVATGTARFTGVEFFNRSMVFQRQLTHAIGHMHLTRDGNGDDIAIWTNSNDSLPIANCQNGIVKVRLADAHQTCLLQLDWSLAVHITAPDGNGWSFVETYDPLDPPPSAPAWKIYTNEILQLKLDGTETRRLLHHRSRQTATYGYQPRATVSRDGTRLVFTSNYGLQSILGYPAGYTDVYLVAVPSLVPPRVNISDARSLEGNSGTTGMVFTVTLSHASDLPVTVGYETGNGSAAAPADYVAISSGTLTFAPGETTRTIQVTVNGDTFAETDETFFVNLSSATNAVIDDGQGLGTIVDDDLAPAVQWTNLVGVAASGGSLSKSGGTSAWDSGAVSRQLLLSGDGQVEFVASETTTHRMAGLGNGDSSQGYADLEYAVYLTSSGTFAVYESGIFRTVIGGYASGDRFSVGVESGVVKYRRNGGLFYTSGVPPTYPLLVDTSLSVPGATVTDARVLGFTAPPPSLSISDVSVTEGNAGSTMAAFTVSLSGESSNTVTVNYGTANGTASAPSDYASAAGTLTFAPGQTTGTITVAVNGDAVAEANETFFVNLSNPANAVIGDGQGLGTIVDDDLAPAVQWTNLVGVAASGGSLSKSGGTSAWDSGAVSRQLLLSGDGQVEFVASETTTHRMAGLGNGDSSQGYADLEYAVYLTSSGTFAVYESGIFRTVIGGYASGDRFSVGVESGVVKYRRNGGLFYTSGVPPTYPLLVDTSLSVPGATVTDARVLGFTAPPPSLSISDVSVTEGNAGSTMAAFTVSLSGESSNTVTVNYGTANGTASAPSDYASAAGTLTFAPGQTTGTITVAVNGDAVAEANETFFVNLSNPANAVIGDGQGLGTILNDDLAPAVQWTNLVGVVASGGSLSKSGGTSAWDSGAVSRQLLLSGDGQVEFVASETTTHRMAGLGNGDSSQGYADLEYAVYLTSSGTFAVYESGIFRTAIGGYASGDRFSVGVESGVVKYRRNGGLFYTSSVPPTYPLLVDTSLSVPGATVTDARVLGFTAPPPSLSISDVSVTEGNAGSTMAAFTVSLSGESSNTVTVNYGTANGTASAPSDYASAAGTLTFAPGQTTGTITVAVNGDAVAEANETFFVNLSNPANAVIGDGQGLGTILNDDLAPAVQWTNLVGVVASGGSLSKSGGTSAWDSGAVSRQLLLSGDGQVEFVASETTTHRMAGLGNGDSSQGYADLEYAVYLTSSGTFAVYESGIFRTVIGGYASGDRFSVGVESGVVKYRRNGGLFYTSGVPPTYPLLVDTSLSVPGATVTDARVLGFTLPPP